MLIIRVWTEEGSSEPLRAQVRIHSPAGDRVLTLSKAEAVCTTVREWLDDFTRSDDRLG